MRRITAAMISLVGLCAWTALAQAVSPDDRCKADKLKRAGQYSFCRLKAESKAVRTFSSPDYTKCDTKFSLKWGNAETQGAGMCPTTGDAGSMQTRVTGDTNDIAACLNGTCPAGCGDLVKNGNESCDGSDLGGASCTSLGFASGALACTAGCGYDVSGCQSQAFPASGQTTAYGMGTDGDVQAGDALSYTDNGDGTITDNNTGLMWEKKDDSGGIHDKDNTYTWCGASCFGTWEMDGTITTTFLAGLNGGGGFAGYTDWRIPNAKELQSIVDHEVFSPSVDPAFHQSGTCTGCLDVTLASCSCTGSSYHWSSTTFARGPSNAWLVNFNDGDVDGGIGKNSNLYVRAVRGGEMLVLLRPEPHTGTTFAVDVYEVGATKSGSADSQAQL